MSLTADAVTAIIVTRGDHPEEVAEVVSSLPYGEVIVWDNSLEPENLKVYGRWAAIERASNDVLYFQDDDIVFTQHDELLAAYDPNAAVVNMPDWWWNASMYPAWNSCQYGAGSLVPRGLTDDAFERYLALWPRDDLFLSYCDNVPGVLAPFTRLNLNYEPREWYLEPGRLCTTPGNHDWRMILMERVFVLRRQA